MNTFDSLGIIWPVFGSPQIETPGISFYGLFAGVNEFPVAARSIEEVWIDRGHQTFIYQLQMELGIVFALDVKFEGIPREDDWIETIEMTLSSLVNHGAFISWCGGELCLSSPMVFARGGAIVYAAYSAKTRLLCNADLFEEWQGLTDSQCEILMGSVASAFPDRWRQALEAGDEWEPENGRDLGGIES